MTVVGGGKDLEDDQKESYGDAEWKERVEKWKNRQEKRGLVSKFGDGSGNDQPDDDDDYLYVILSTLYIIPTKLAIYLFILDLVHPLTSNK